MTVDAEMSGVAGRRVYGELLEGVSPEGRSLRAGAFDENMVRAAAGVTMALGVFVFVKAFYAHSYLPIQVVTTFFFVEFLIRVLAGMQYSPVGMLGRWLTRRQTPHWVSAKPKRFAWTLGLMMSGAMMVITNAGIRGELPMTICLICITLMWLEAVLGFCLGCEIHRLLVGRGWMARDEEYEICTNGDCAMKTPT